MEAGAEGESRSGELLLSGPGVFKEYWRRTEATKESFDKKGAFKTGDIVEEDSEGWFRILGRRSVDIIKSGGYKISALEIERELIEHSKIAQAAVGEFFCGRIVATKRGPYLLKVFSSLFLSCAYG